MEVNADTEIGSSSGRSRAIARTPARSRGQENNGTDALSRGLGWFSIGLGLAQLVAPRGVARIAGAEPTDDTIHLMRALGAREFLSGVGILSGQRSDTWLRARVAGDVMDLALLGKLMASESADRGKAAMATLAVAGVTALDVLAAKRSGNARDNGNRNGNGNGNGSGDPPSVQPGTRTIRRTITINRSPDEVESFWRQHASVDPALDEHIRFVPAPGGRGTEVHLLRTYEKPGPIASVLAKVRHTDPDQLAFDELFSLKQIIETGDVVVSDAWLNGPHAPRPAQPA
jgi:hypothetical protein